LGICELVTFNAVKKECLNFFTFSFFCYDWFVFIEVTLLFLYNFFLLVLLLFLRRTSCKVLNFGIGIEGGPLLKLNRCGLCTILIGKCHTEIVLRVAKFLTAFFLIKFNNAFHPFNDSVQLLLFFGAVISR